MSVTIPSLITLPRDVVRLVLLNLSLKESLIMNFVCRYFRSFNRTFEFDRRFENLTAVDFTFLKDIEKRYSKEEWLDFLKLKLDEPIFPLLIKVYFVSEYLLYQIPAKHNLEEYNKFCKLCTEFWQKPNMSKFAGQHNQTIEKIENEVNVKSFRWILLAAEQKVASAQYMVSRYYAKGQVVKKDKAKAFTYCHLAALQDYKDAYVHLGYMFNNGIGVKQNKLEAAHWNRLAAENNDPTGQYNFAICYKFGIGVTKDLQEALHWFSRAADQGDGDSQFELGIAYAQGIDVERNMDKALKFLKAAAEQGNCLAQYNLGFIYASGTDVPKDEQEGIRWLRLAAEQDDITAKITLGVVLPPGEEADRWFKEGLQGMTKEDYEVFAEDSSELSKRILVRLNESGALKKV